MPAPKSAAQGGTKEKQIEIQRESLILSRFAESLIRIV